MIAFNSPDAEIYFPEGGNAVALSKTTHLGIGAHQDDLEIFAIHGILTAYDDPNAYFTGVTVTDGRGAPRSGPYANLTDDALWAVRMEEQKAAARIGKYHAQVLLNYPSQTVKAPQRAKVVEDLKRLLQATQPAVIYTHNLADKHDTHVAVALAVLQAYRESRPWMQDAKIYGCEVWRDLDWLPQEKKLALDVSAHPEMQETLLTVFKSQIVGGKRYDLATLGRRQANATYDESHATDQAARMTYALDLTPLIRRPEANISDFMDEIVLSLAKDVRDRLERLGASPD